MIFLELFLTFFKIGLFTFGGGYAMLPFIQEEVLANGWMTSEAIIDFIAVSESTPGPFAVNIATYVGSEAGMAFGTDVIGNNIVASFIGSVCATLGVIMPSFIVIICVAKFYERFKKSEIVSGCMTGLKPAVVGLIGAAIISMIMTVLFEHGISSFKTPELYISLAILGAVIVPVFKKVNPIIIICISAVLGIIAGFAFGL